MLARKIADLTCRRRATDAVCGGGGVVRVQDVIGRGAVAVG